MLRNAAPYLRRHGKNGLAALQKRAFASQDGEISYAFLRNHARICFLWHACMHSACQEKS